MPDNNSDISDWPDYDGISDPSDEPINIDEPVVEGIIPLGHDRGIYYYLSRASRQIVALPAGLHTSKSLLGLASAAHYWQRSRFVNQKGAVQWDDAADWLMTECRDVGIFDPSRLRGRGAWMDKGRSVLHTGNSLIVDGASSPLMLPGSSFIYEAARPLSTVMASPLDTKAANQLVTICQSLRWERGISGTLLAGFIALAPICGGLAWRASIWITGGAGSGKSWVNENLIRPALGGTALQVTSKTSEAGIRQALMSDARPVLFDEAEREDASSAARMQGVLDLVRQSASEGGSAIIKGSQSQTGAKHYVIRSMFGFSSINVGIDHQADESRISVLGLRTPTHQTADDAVAFARLQALALSTITPEFSAGLLARSVRLLPVIRHNAEIFAQAVALHLGSRRMGDQIGTLLAGAYSLHSVKEISLEDAQAYVAKQAWGADSEQDTERDENRLLTVLTQSRVKFAKPNSSAIDITVGRLIEAAWGREQQISCDAAEMELRSIGIRTDGADAIYVSTNHPALKRVLQGTPWSSGWSRALGRLPGAMPSKSGIRFGSMHNSKAVWISRATLDGSG